MLELDIILNRFYKNHINELTNSQLTEFEKLLNYPDPDLYAWLMGYEHPIQDVADVIALIQLHDKAN